MPLKYGQDFDARLVWNSAPNIDSRDNLDLIVTLPDGTIFLGNDLAGEGIKDDIETIEGVHIPSESLSNFEFVEVKIVAREVGVGPVKSVVGLNGDKIGFALAVKGVVREEVETLTPWISIPLNEKVDSEQGDDSMSKIWFLLMLIILLVILGLVVLDARSTTRVWKIEDKEGEGEPSNHDRGSLPIAVAPHTGDDDE
jgi:hypothetical protein